MSHLIDQLRAGNSSLIAKLRGYDVVEQPQTEPEPPQPEGLFNEIKNLLAKGKTSAVITRGLDNHPDLTPEDKEAGKKYLKETQARGLFPQISESVKQGKGLIGGAPFISERKQPTTGLLGRVSPEAEQTAQQATTRLLEAGEAAISPGQTFTTPLLERLGATPGGALAVGLGIDALLPGGSRKDIESVEKLAKEAKLLREAKGLQPLAQSAQEAVAKGISKEEWIKGQDKTYKVGESFEMGKIIENPFKEGIPTPQKVKEINNYIASNKDRYNPKFIKLYHATDPSLPITDKGLLPTSATRRKSFQSESGYVYLANTPERAKVFGDLGNQSKSIVYEVVVPVNKLLPDLDQLNNLRSVGEKVGNTIGDSIVYGGGVRIKGKIEPYAVRKLPDLTRSQLSSLYDEAVKLKKPSGLLPAAAERRKKQKK